MSVIDKIFLVLFNVLAVIFAVIWIVDRDMDHMIVGMLCLILGKLQANDVLR
jgi:hypothetical protein